MNGSNVFSNVNSPKRLLCDQFDHASFLRMECCSVVHRFALKISKYQKQIETLNIVSLAKLPLGSAAISTLLTLTACTTTTQPPLNIDSAVGRDPDRLLVVDCLLPGQLRRLGGRISFLTPRRPTKVSVSECEIRGGEYVAYDRANFATSLKIWLPQAETGDPKAQTLVGEIFEKGLGQIADPVVAASWYQKAAAQGYSRAKINLGYLYESGLGVERDLTKAMNLYRQAAGFEDGSLEYVTSVQIAARKQQAAKIPLLINQVEKAKSQLSTEREAYTKLQSDYFALEQQADSIRKKLATVATSSSGSAPEENLNNAAQMGQLLKDMEALKENLANSESQTTRLVDELEIQQQKTSSLRQQLKSTSAQLYETQDELDDQVRTIEELEQQLVDQRANANTENTNLETELQNQLSATIASRNSLQEKIEQLKSIQTSQSKKYEDELRIAEAREHSLTLDLERTRATLDELQQALLEKDANYRSQLDTLGSSQTDLQTRIQQQQATIAGLEENIEAIEKTRSDQESAAIAAAGSEIAKLQAELESAKLELVMFEAEREKNELNSIQTLKRLENELQNQRALVTKQSEIIGNLQKNVSDVSAKQAGPLIEAIPEVITSGPVIEIIDPPVTVHNDSLSIPVMTDNGMIDVIGRVSSETDLLSFRINGGAENLNENGIFQHNANVEKSLMLSLAAVDNAGERTAIDVELTRTEKESVENTSRSLSIDVSQVDFGEYHALIIGNGKYQAMPDIGTAVNDATAMAKMLENRFGFKTELLLDADRYDILAALNRKRDELSRQDNLLIYFAGHGEIGNGSGYWLPTDADPVDKSSWISNVSIASFIDSMNAKHVMIVADSVFSGTLSRSSLVRLSASMNADERLRLYEIVANSKVRTVLSSGAERPFTGTSVDSTHSVFTSGILKALSSNSGHVIMAHDLFVNIRNQLGSVTSPSGSSLSPRYAPIKYSGHENGEFIFVPVDRQVGILSAPLSYRDYLSDDRS